MKLFWWPHPIQGFYVVAAEGREQARAALVEKIKKGEFPKIILARIAYINDNAPAEVESGEAIWLC